MGFRKLEAKELDGNAFRMFDDGWALITAGTPESFNTMTIAWGCVGWLWYKPVCITYVRESRYTTRFTDARDCFTVAFFKEQEYRRELGVLGSKSGRDMDKMHDSGLTPFELDGEMAFAEASAIFVCRKLYADTVDPAKILVPEVMEKCYSGSNEGDFHRMYTAEIVSAYIKE
ncbi:MAG: flavin reductase family protein [Clostridia bacterium]|nr:flavin reductase family protein [Clostridia bacterium]